MGTKLNKAQNLREEGADASVIKKANCANGRVPDVETRVVETVAKRIYQCSSIGVHFISVHLVNYGKRNDLWDFPSELNRPWWTNFFPL